MAVNERNTASVGKAHEVCAASHPEQFDDFLHVLFYCLSRLDRALAVTRASIDEQLVALRERTLIGPDEFRIGIAASMHKQHRFALTP